MKVAVVLHHTGNGSPKPQYESVYAYHNRGAGGKWPKGHGIQYTHFIEKNGEHIYTGNEADTTWHSGSDKWNKKSIAVCLAGDFTEEQPTEAQKHALYVVIDGIQKRWGIPDSEIYLHREVRPKPTACPGTDLRLIFLQQRGIEGQSLIKKLQNALKHVTAQRAEKIKRLLQRLGVS